MNQLPQKSSCRKLSCRTRRYIIKIESVNVDAKLCQTTCWFSQKFCFRRNFASAFVTMNYIHNDSERHSFHFKMKCPSTDVTKKFNRSLPQLIHTSLTKSNIIVWQIKQAKTIFNGSQKFLIWVLVSRHVLIGYELKLVKTFVGQICDIGLQ